MTSPGPALRSSLYAVLIRDSLHPLPERAAGETKSPAQRRARDGARDGGGEQFSDPNGAHRLLNSTPAETFNHGRGTT